MLFSFCEIFDPAIGVLFCYLFLRWMMMAGFVEFSSHAGCFLNDYLCSKQPWGFLGGTWSGVHLPVQETWVRSLGQEDPLGEEIASHSSILAWRISWTEEPGGLQSMGLQRVGHNSHTQHIHTQQLYEISVFLNSC